MNEELRARAIEAALAASGMWWADGIEDERDENEAIADAVLGVVADWCDEQRNRAIDEAGYTWTDALNRVAGACRPGGGGPDVSERYFTAENPCQECGLPSGDLLAEVDRLHAELEQRRVVLPHDARARLYHRCYTLKGDTPAQHAAIIELLADYGITVEDYPSHLVT